MTIEKFKTQLQHLWRQYGSLNNVVIAIALVVAAGWAWGSITMMQRNFALQRDYDERKRQLALTDLEVATLEYQRNYYKSDEYKDLAAREHLGLASPGEKVLLLPPNSEDAKRSDRLAVATDTPVRPADGSAPSNLDQWLNFLMGNSAQHLQD